VGDLNAGFKVGKFRDPNLLAQSPYLLEGPPTIGDVGPHLNGPIARAERCSSTSTRDELPCSLGVSSVQSNGSSKEKYSQSSLGIAFVHAFKLAATIATPRLRILDAANTPIPEENINE
jgi:hypothetical protein